MRAAENIQDHTQLLDTGLDLADFIMQLSILTNPKLCLHNPPEQTVTYVVSGLLILPQNHRDCHSLLALSFEASVNVKMKHC